VEAVSIRAAQACFIQGTVTAWKVRARRITLEDRARAFIMLQESETLELSKSSRLVGNFANEKELFLMMGKFTAQLRELPGSVDMASPTPLAESVHSGAHSIPASSAPARDEGAEHLRSAQALLEREIVRTDLTPAETEAIREVLYALRERNLPRVANVYRDAFSEVKSPSDALRQALDHLDRYFRR
jgi:hypothetical protein